MRWARHRPPSSRPRLRPGGFGLRTVALTLDVSAVPADPVGAGQYTLYLAAALARRPDLDLTLIGRRTDRERWGRPPPVPAW